MKTKILLAILLLMICLSLFFSGATQAQVTCSPTDTILRASSNPTGAAGAGVSSYGTVSDDGRYVAFISTATDLVPFFSAYQNIYLYDRQTCTITLVSALNGTPANQSSTSPRISGNGRYVVYASDATNLVANDTNLTSDIFMYDHQTGITSLISVSTSGGVLNNTSIHPDVSADGRYVVFESGGSNAIASDSNNMKDVFIRDTVAETTTRVQLNGVEPNGYSEVPFISADGSTIVFRTMASNWVANDTNNGFDFIYFQRQTSQASAIRESGSNSTFPSDFISISATGRYVAFITTNILLYDALALNVATLVSGMGNNTRVNGVSSDGRYVMYTTPTAAIAGDTNGVNDVFVLDRSNNLTRRISVSGSLAQLNYDSFGGGMSPDGRYVTEYSADATLVANDSNNTYDVYLVDAGTLLGTLGTATPTGTQTPTATLTPYPTLTPQPNACAGGANPYMVRATITGAGVQTNERVENSTMGISNDGRFVAYRSTATNLVPNDNNGRPDVFLFDSLNCQIRLVSVSNTGVQSNGDVFNVTISDNGRYVAYTGFANNIVPYPAGTCTTPGSCQDVYVYDVQTGVTRRVSDTAAGTHAGGGGPEFSGNGTYVSFESDANTLVPNDTTGIDIFLRNLQTNAIERIPIDGYTSRAVLSYDGRYVVFTTSAHLGGTEATTYQDVYRYDRQLGVMELVSVGVGNVPANADSSARSRVDVSDDGRYVVFESKASNLVNDDWNDTWDVFVRDMVTGTTQMISRTDLGIIGNGESLEPRISNDGRYIIFHSEANNLVPGLPIGSGDLTYLYDQLTGETRLVSRKANFEAIRGNLGEISGDGTRVVFSSWTENVIPGDTNNMQDVFITRWDQLPHYLSGSDILTWGNFDDSQIVTDANGSYINNFSWFQSSTNYGTPLCATSICGNGGGTAYPASNTYWGWFGGNDGHEEGILAQYVQIPPGTAELHFNMWVGLDQATSASFTVKIDSTTVWSVTKPFTGFTAGWKSVTINLQAYTDNMPHLLIFDGITDGGATNISLDDVSLIWTNNIPTATATATQTATPTATPTRPVSQTDSIALYNPTTQQISVIDTLQDPPPAASIITYLANAPVVGQQFVMGDWDGDGQQTPGLWPGNGAFWFTNGLSANATWTGIWIGAFPDVSLVAGRWGIGVNHDCIGVVQLDYQPVNVGFPLHYRCDLSTTVGTLYGQWMGIVLPGSVPYQFVSGDYDHNGYDSIAARRDTLLTWSNVTPGGGAVTIATFPLAQYFGAPSSGTSYVVSGDWDNDGTSTFGFYYPSGLFVRKNDLQWNSGVYFYQHLGQPIGATTIASAWRRAVLGYSEFLLPTETETETPTPTETYTETPTPSETYTETATPTETPTDSATEMVTEDVTATDTLTPTPFPTLGLVFTPSTPFVEPATATETPIVTPTETPSGVMPLLVENMDDVQGWAASSGWSLQSNNTATGAGQAWQLSGGQTVETLLLNTPIDLRNVSGAVLTFYSQLGEPTAAEVQISLDGVNWAPLYSVPASEGWQLQTVPLNAYQGAVVSLQFVWTGVSEPDITPTWTLDELHVEGIIQPMVTNTPAPTQTSVPTETLTETPTTAPSATATATDTETSTPLPIVTEDASAVVVPQNP